MGRCGQQVQAPCGLVMFALVDVNNFYASCEQLFNPKLRGRPLVVLSNNDGCVVARSAEARALGVPMAGPWHKVRKLVEDAGGLALSSNYTLYADMSDRVVTVLSEFTHELEVYSIDESFLDFSGIRDRITHGRKIKEKIAMWLGLPVCVGIGPTKTLAKLANHIAKKRSEYGGVCDLAAMSEEQKDKIFGEIEVGEVWGVGRKLRERLGEMGITTVAGLRGADIQTIRSRFSVVLERTVRELRGAPCAELELTPPAKQEIISSRTFSGYVRDIETLRSAVTHHASRAAEKMREQDSVAGVISLFIRTNPFRDGPQIQRAASVALPNPSAHTPLLASVALRALARLYKPGFDYRKVGVMLRDLSPAGYGQIPLLDLEGEEQPTDRRAKFNETLDNINKRWGRGMAKLLVEGNSIDWHMARDRLSPAYTTSWSDVPTVH